MGVDICNTAGGGLGSGEERAGGCKLDVRKEGGRKKEGLMNRAGKRAGRALASLDSLAVRDRARRLGHGMAAARGYFHVHVRDVIALTSLDLWQRHETGCGWATAMSLE